MLRALDLIKKGDYTTLSGGLNSTLYLLNIDNQKCVLKKYAESGAPLRLAREIAFLEMCHRSEVNNVPKLLNFDDSECLALLEYVKGNRVVEADETFVIAASTFVNTINKKSQNHNTPYLAKDAFVNSSQVLTNLVQRAAVLKSCEMPADAKALILKILSSVDKLLDATPEIVKEFGIIQTHIRQENASALILSPSDFGIHNAIETESGIYFLDFEYSGKDSPLKLFGDFISHPQHHLNENLIRLFYDRTKETLCFELEHFSELFLLLFRLKWCLIMCNPIIKPAQVSSKHLEELSEYYRIAVKPLL